MLRTIAAAFVGSVILFSCSKGTSTPNYKFMKAPKEGLAAKVGDVEITHAQVQDGIESELYELERKIFDTKMNKLKAVLLEELMKQDPAKQGLSNDEYMDTHIAKGVKVDDKEIDAFIKERNIPQDQINPGARESIRNFLLAEKKRTAVEEWLAEKTKSSGIEVYFDKPRRPSFEVEIGKAPVLGSDKAPVTIVEFSDFQCPYCAQAAETINRVKKEYGNKVRVVFKQFPLPFHSQAKQAANAALCAWEQKPDYFWKMHDALFADQTKLSREDLANTAKKIGVKEDDFMKCFNDNKYLSMINQDIEQGKDLGVKSTPTFYVNGKLVQGAQPFESFKEIIDEELADN